MYVYIYIYIYIYNNKSIRHIITMQTHIMLGLLTSHTFFPFCSEKCFVYHIKCRHRPDEF